MVIDQQDLDKLIANLDNETEWYIQIGVEYLKRNNGKLKFLPIGIETRTKDFTFFEFYGRNVWDLIEPDVKKWLCLDGYPREWVAEVINGEVRNFALAIIAPLSAKFNIGVGLAIPITAFILKKGIVNFCKIEHKNIRRRRSNEKHLE